MIVGGTNVRQPPASSKIDGMSRRFQFGIGCLLWLMAAVPIVLVQSPAFAGRVNSDVSAALMLGLVLWGAVQLHLARR
jgi:predicted metal-binding membrane protein